MAEPEDKAKPAEPEQPAAKPASAKPASAKPAAAKSHFDEQDGGEGRDDAATGGERSRALGDVLTMYGSQTSGVSVVGATVNISTLVGGDGFLHADDHDRPILNMFSDRMVAELSRLFVEPAGFSALGEPIGRDGLVLLGTRPRWGNTATAVRLLDGVKAIYELRFAGALAELAVDKLPSGSGFVLEATEARVLVALRPQNLADLGERLRTAGSRLVVVTDAERAAEHGSRPVWRALGTPPDAYELTLRHLADRLGSREQGEEMLERTELAVRLRETEPGAFDVHRLVELAADLAEAAQGRGTVPEALERFEARAGQAVEQWFDSDELAEPYRRALVLSLAVLNGMSYDAVARAATLLERRWQAQEPAPAAGSRRRPEPRRERLKAARARLRHEVRNARFGPGLVEIASFWDPGYPERILRHYWQEHDYDRDVLLDWLRDVADDVEVAVGIRAAGAVGFLATFAFDTVRRDVIVPWAGSGKGDERELAVAALAIPARTAETSARTIRLVAYWASREGDAQCMAAVRALGGSVGAVLDPGPDALLAKLAVDANGRLATAIGDSVGELLAVAAPERQRALLELLAAWADEPRRGRQAAGVLGFLQVAWSRWIREEDGPAWPLLLWLADRDATMATAVRKVWRISLIAPDTDNAVPAVLRSWASAAESVPDMRRAFVDLFTGVPETERQAKLLRFHADQLRTGKPASPDTARKLLDALTKGR